VGPVSVATLQRDLVRLRADLDAVRARIPEPPTPEELITDPVTLGLIAELQAMRQAREAAWTQAPGESQQPPSYQEDHPVRGLLLVDRYMRREDELAGRPVRSRVLPPVVEKPETTVVERVPDPDPDAALAAFLAGIEEDRPPVRDVPPLPYYVPTPQERLESLRDGKGDPLPWQLQRRRVDLDHANGGGR